jgi:hypothetical protein
LGLIFGVTGWGKRDTQLYPHINRLTQHDQEYLRCPLVMEPLKGIRVSLSSEHL